MWRCWILFILTSAPAAYTTTLLLANKEGAWELDTNAPGEINHVIHYSIGVADVNYHYARKEIYLILKSKNDDPRIVRLSRADTFNRSETQTSIPDWCHRDRLCYPTYGTKGFYLAETILTPESCVKAGNLVVDWVRDNIYWTCDPLRKSPATLHQASLRGVHTSSILTIENSTQDTHRIASVDIDPYQKKLFYLHSDVLESSQLNGKEKRTMYQFGERDVGTPLKISVDIRRQKVYVMTQLGGGERALSSLDYDRLNFQTHCRNTDPGWKFGPRVVNSKVYWISNSTTSTIPCSATGSETVDLESLRVVQHVTQWRVYDPAVQSPPPANCSLHQCSYDCRYSTWPKVQCVCPAGMVLADDQKSCTEQKKYPTREYTPVPEDATELQNSQSADRVSGTDKVYTSVGESAQVVTVETPSLPDVIKQMTNQSAEVTTLAGAVTSNVTESTQTGNVTGLLISQSADDLSNNATESAEAIAVVVSSSDMTLLYVVITTIGFSMFVVVVLMKRKAKRGNYRPSLPDERIDITM